MRIYGVIMAGGGGTRFWPLSRQSAPKQLLNLSGRGPMIAETFDRMAAAVPPEDIYIVTSAHQADGVLDALDGRTDRAHILAEPEARSTAACIGLAATVLSARSGDGLMLVTPSDHFIGSTELLTAAWREGFRAAEDGDCLVTVGIRPDRPATGYGYIRFDTDSDAPVRKVFSFHEKPDEATARRYLDSGAYCWNSGMFIWRTDAILRALRTFAPDLAEPLDAIRGAAAGPDADEAVARIYPGIRAVSVDRAVLEPAAALGQVLMVPCDFVWNDVGSWDMMEVIHRPDADGNILIGDSLAVNCRDCVILSRDRLVSAVDVEGLVIVQTPDAVMVCRKDRAQNVRQIVEALQAAGRTDLL